MSEGENPTEPTCEKCGKPISRCTCTTVTVKHEGLGKSENEKSKEEIQKELDEKTAILSAIALKSFEDEKEAFLSVVKDETKRQELSDIISDSPEKLENAKLMAKFIGSAYEQHGGGVRDEGTETLPAHSSVRGQAPKDQKTEDIKSFINEQYDILEDPTKSQKEKDKANQIVNSFWSEFRRGARGREKYDIPPTMACPKCGNVIVTRKGDRAKCDSCGWIQSQYTEY